MEQKINKELNKDQISLMIADYLNDKLSSSERAEFEKSIVNYSDIISEVNEYKLFFNKIDKTSYENSISQRTRNLSVVVTSQLFSKKRRFNKLFLKYLSPIIAFGLVLIVILILNNQPPKPFDNSNTISNNVIRELIEKSINSDTLISNNDISDFSYVPAMQENSVEFNNMNQNELDDILNEDMSKSISIKHDDLNLMSETELIDIIDNVKQNDLQIIIKELSDVKINP